MKPRIAILISGGGSNMVSLINAIKYNKINALPAIVISNNSNAAGLDKAADLDIPTRYIDHRKFSGNREVFEKRLHNLLQDEKIDIICLAGFMRILTKSFIDQWNNKILNIHPSLLPKYKGLNTHQRAIDAFDKISGCSVHIVTSELDGGLVLGQRTVDIESTDTASTLAEKVLIEEHILYPEILNKFINDRYIK
ncbi:phosphoribosylglycinamide formyltransferase [Amylibacter sp.]|nr:phosphoribosylglycinamide formyltransferase [Amylibacter sp.]